MAVLDTSVAIERARSSKEILEAITAVTLVEFPQIVGYKGFRGEVIFPTFKDFILAHRLQLKLMDIGKPKGFADLLIASICINRGEKLLTRDEDFLDIARVSSLQVEIVG